MRIYDMMTNRLINPVGFTVGRPRLSYKVDETDGKRQVAARVRVATDEAMRDILFDSGKKSAIDSLCYQPDIALSPRTRYWWDVEVWADNDDTARSAPQYFETGKLNEPWQARWITADVPGNMNLLKDVAVDKPVASARVYAVGVGLFELYINGEKAGDELLAPFCNDYDTWLQTVTFDVGAMLRSGQNALTVMLGDGWYKGRFSFYQRESGLYGDTQALLLELHILYADGTTQVVASDESFTATESRVRFANIYDGETYDAAFDSGKRFPARLYDGLDTSRVMDRLSPPVRVTERLVPAAILTTPAGETVLDLGQEITGYLEFRTSAPKGTALKLSYFEILQHGNYYRDNLRSAKQEFAYTAGGGEAVVRPRFTFFGFRYVKLEGFDNPRLEDFTGCVVHSDIRQTGRFRTDHKKVNRLADNALWGQRGNFLDVPTDCPQRDERMGWTGDAQAFSGTACFQMESAAFFDKYMFDMKKEQDKRGGAVPHVVPAVRLPGEASCAWADAATVIPWNLYLFYGDRAQLAAHYPSMRDWVEWIVRADEATGGTRLWRTGFHFADWLALDTKDGTPMGGTDPLFIATAYYYYSTSLTLKAAKALGYAEDIARYEKLLHEILAAIKREYFTPAGRLAETTQTAYVCALFMRFAPPEHEALLARLLEREFEQSKGKLRTGFVGTAYLCRALSGAGLNALAYRLFLNEEYPGWLYEVNMGATTVWERWNSVLPDGLVSDTGMNSLNHYAYGAVMEWAFRDVAGINPDEDMPGFRHALLRPRPDERLPKAGATYDSAMGLYASAWEIKDNVFYWHIRVPFGATAKAVFPNADAMTLADAFPDTRIQTNGTEVFTILEAGDYSFAYTPVKPFNPLDIDTKMSVLLENKKARALLEKLSPGLVRECLKTPAHLDKSLREAMALPFAELGPGVEDAIREGLREMA